jgi:hypothetical protein
MKTEKRIKKRKEELLNILNKMSMLESLSSKGCHLVGQITALEWVLKNE